jgi:hypothetical protein
MADSYDIDRALVALLRGDATLNGLLPDGIYLYSADAGVERFAIVSIVTAFDTPQFGRRAWEDIVYLVEALVLRTTSDSNTVANQAAARIDAVLDDQPLSVPGYGYMTMHRALRHPEDETDEKNPAIKFYRRAGHYRVQMSLL